MKGSLVTRIAFVAGLLTLWSTTDASAIGPSSGRARNLHANDSKISRIQAVSVNDDFTALDGYGLLASRHSSSSPHHRNQQAAHQQLKPRATAMTGGKSPKSVDGRKLSNHDMLRSLGLAKLNIPSSHHRKRLAVESRHHARPDDSHMYIIKLPPNPAYYTKTGGGHDRNAIDDPQKKVTVDFMSNGKPGRIYHWNLPVLKRMLSQEGGGGGAGGISSRTASNSRVSNDISELIDIRHIPTWTKPWEQDSAADKAYRKNDRLSSDDSMLGELGVPVGQQQQHKSPTYYAPRPKKNTNVQKYFPGNGKPKSFYVIKGKSQTPHYQTLIP